MDFVKLKNRFVFIPVGGCDGIGINFYLYQFGGKWIAVDCGIGFPEGHKTPGAEIMIPDLSFLIHYKIKLSALIITHSHEDHIGAVCDLYHYLKCPVYTTTFGKNFLHYRMTEHKIKEDEIDIREIKKNKRQLKIGDFEIEFIPMTHSTIEALGVYIKTPAGTVFHTGDWRMDEKPVLGEKIDVKRIKEICKDGVSALVCDSTNAFQNKEKHYEYELEKSIYEILKNEKGRIFVGSFASNIMRTYLISKIAKKLGRKFVLTGRSMERMMKIAQQSGYLKDVEFYTSNDAQTFKRNEVLILGTGCQGEEMASLSKISNGTHKNLKIQKGDTVVFSSKVIPGNEISVNNVVNNLIAKGVKVISDSEFLVHVSGHPYQDELKELYKWTKPKTLIPVHGEWFMLDRHRDFAKSSGIGSLFVKNGDVVLISDKELEIHGKIKVSTKCVDGARFIDQDSVVFKERVAISKNGILFCNLIFDGKKKLLCEPEIKTLGIFEYNIQADVEIIKNIKKLVAEKVEKYAKTTAKFNQNELQNKVSDAIRKEVYRQTLKNPMVDVFIKKTI